MATKHDLNNTREFVELLKKEDELLEIHEVIDPDLELAELHRHVVQQKGKAILFHNVKGTNFSVATNLYGSIKRIELAFGKRPQEWIQDAVNVAENFFPPSFKKLWQTRRLALDLLKVGTKKVTSAPVLQKSLPHADLNQLPQIKSWPEDGGAFITLPLVYTESPQTGKSNLGMYRIQMHNQNQCGVHMQIHRGGGFHYHEAEKQNQSLKAHIYVGGPPALTLAAILPLPENVPEIFFASLIMGRRLKLVHNRTISELPILADADFCIMGEIPPLQRMPEGPFGDHYGYYSLQHDYPFLSVKKIYHQKNAIYPATVVGRPPQEDHFITCYLQDLLKPLIHLTLPQVKEIWAYEESGVHTLTGAIVKDRYPREALTTALRILGEGQLSLSKCLIVTDQNCNVKDFKKLFQTVLERIDLEKDLFVISNISQDTLDYTGPNLNEGSKAILLGLGEKKRDLPTKFDQTFTNNVLTDPRVFCPGALVVTGPKFYEGDAIPQLLAKETCLTEWPMVFLVDNSVQATQSTEDFLWHVFTRFEPAHDIVSKDSHVSRFHIELKQPVIVDCRFKPWYPRVLESDPNVLSRLGPVFRKLGI